MPELAEVEYFRQCWDCGLGEPITAIKLHSRKRIFRGVPVEEMRQCLRGATYLASEARGKQLLFRFSGALSLGLHLGMTGRLSVAPSGFCPGKHDHLVLYQREHALVFSDSRLFGRVRFAHAAGEPGWWAELPPPVNSSRFTKRTMAYFLGRHPKLPIKATLLLQAGFPGIGNWMADEILWRAGIDPRILTGQICSAEIEPLWMSLRKVCAGALRHISKDFSDPPRGWLFHERWKRAGLCPIHRKLLHRQTVGGRTTVWCSECQRSRPVVTPAATLPRTLPQTVRERGQVRQKLRQDLR